jgi:hypothetical protein
MSSGRRARRRGRFGGRGGASECVQTVNHIRRLTALDVHDHSIVADSLCVIVVQILPHLLYFETGRVGRLGFQFGIPRRSLQVQSGQRRQWYWSVADHYRVNNDFGPGSP